MKNYTFKITNIVTERRIDGNRTITAVCEQTGIEVVIVINLAVSLNKKQIKEKLLLEHTKQLMEVSDELKIGDII